VSVGARINERPLSVPQVAERWGCSEGLIYKLIRDGRLQCFRPGSLIRVTAAEVERFECQTTASNDCGEGSPSFTDMMESGSDANCSPRIARAQRRKRDIFGPVQMQAPGPSPAA
jgi:excisionase family DNA binding protein